MRRYIQRLQNEKTPHERRRLAMRAASLVSAVLIVGWLATLGVRLSSYQHQVAQTQASPQNSQTASLGGIIPVEQPKTTLIVATTTGGY